MYRTEHDGGGSERSGSMRGDRFPSSSATSPFQRPASLSVSQHPAGNPTPFSAFPTAWAISSTGKYMSLHTGDILHGASLVRNPSDLLPPGLLATPQPSTPSVSLLKVLGPRNLAVADGYGAVLHGAPGDSPGTSAGGLSPQVDSLVLPSPSLLPGGVHSLPTPSPSSSHHHRPYEPHGGRSSPTDNAAIKDSDKGTNRASSGGVKGPTSGRCTPGRKRADDSRGGQNVTVGRRAEGHPHGSYATAGMYQAPHGYAALAAMPQAPGSPTVGYATGPYYLARVPAGAMVMGMHHAGSNGSGDNSREGSAHGANNSGAGQGRDTSGGGVGTWRAGGRSAGGGGSTGGPGNGNYVQQQMGNDAGGAAYGVPHVQHGTYAMYGIMAPGMVVPQVMSPVVGSPRGMEAHHMGPMLLPHGPSMGMGHMAMGHVGAHPASGMHAYPPPHGSMAGHHMGMGMHGMPAHLGHPHGYPPPYPHAMAGSYAGGGFGQQPYGSMHGGPGPYSGGRGGPGKGGAAQQAGHGSQKALQPGRSGGSGGLSTGGSGNVAAGNGSGRESPTGGRGRAKADKPRAQEQRERKPGNSRAPAAVAQCAVPLGPLDSQLQALLLRLIPDEAELAAHQVALQAVTQLVASRWPHVKVHLYGSAANGLSIAGSNSIDVTLEVPDMAWDDHAAKAAMVSALGELAAGGPIAPEPQPAAAAEGAAESNAGAGAAEPPLSEAVPQAGAAAATALRHAAVAAGIDAEVAASSQLAAPKVPADAAVPEEGPAVSGGGDGARAVVAPMAAVTVMPKARTPIVKLTVPETKTRVDITINNMLAVSNTRLLADYCALDGRLRQLARLVKHWARTRCVNDAYRGSLSSYAYALLCIWLLQQRRPPILPVLQQRQPHTYNVTVGPWRCSYNDQVDELQDFGADNAESLAELLVAFFDHWAWRHDYNGAVVCVRTGGTTTKAAKEWTKRQGNERHLMCIEDPFELSHDLGRTIDKAAVQVLRREFERAARIFASNPDPLPELLAPLTPEEEAAVATALQSRRRAAKEKEKEKERAKLAAAAAAAAASPADGAAAGNGAEAAAAAAAIGTGSEAEGAGSSGSLQAALPSGASEEHVLESEDADCLGEVILPGDGALCRQPQAPEPASSEPPEQEDGVACVETV